MDYFGMQLQSTGLLVCPPCLDIPNPQKKPIILPPDPDPIMNARPFNYTNAEVDYLTTEGGDHVTEEDGDAIIEEWNGDAMIDYDPEDDT